MVFALAISALAGCREDTATPSDDERIGASASAIVGAGYTTFDAALGGCNDGPNGVDCNGYASKKAVFMSGGPAKGTLADGAYFFAVLTPGAQSKAMSDGGVGNLSDTHAGGTAGDAGGGDVWQDRMFTVSGGKIVYNGPHAVGKSPNGRTIIQLWPFDSTDNPGGVYQLAICAVGATKASQCKYDAFRIAPGGGAVCGDGVVQAGEQCDDGNTKNGDGCSASCKTEAVDEGPCGCGGDGGGGVGVDSTGSTASTTTSSGSGGVGVDSTSSGSGGVGVDSTSSGSGGWGSGSSTSSTGSGGVVIDEGGSGGAGGGDVTPPAINPVCGDGAVQGSEQCDDGNTVGGDGCSATCKTEICVALQRGGPSGEGVADAEIDEAAPNQHQDEIPGLIDVGLGSPKRRQMLLAFDLSVIPAGADVIYAKVTVRQAPQVPDVITARVHRITAGWDEATVTWNDFAGAYDPKVETSFLLSFGPKTFDVLGMAKAWASGTAPNFGMLIEADPATYSVFKSCEWWHTPDRPVLDLCYTVP